MPASDHKIWLASLMYFQVYGKELPLYDYKQQDINYIIQELEIKIREDADSVGLKPGFFH
jgi:hypothetical protein